METHLRWRAHADVQEESAARALDDGIHVVVDDDRVGVRFTGVVEILEFPPGETLLTTRRL